MYVPEHYTGGKILPFLWIKSKRTKLGLSALLLFFSTAFLFSAFRLYMEPDQENLLSVLVFLSLCGILFLAIRKNG